MVDKEPITFENFFESAKAGVSKALAAFRKRKDNEHFEKQQTMADLLAEIARGRRAAEFAKTDFWISDLQPMIEDEARKSQMRPWRPGDTYKEDALKTEYFFTSGKYWMARRIVEQFEVWQEMARNAEEKLKKMQEQGKERRMV